MSEHGKSEEYKPLSKNKVLLAWPSIVDEIHSSTVQPKAPLDRRRAKAGSPQSCNEIDKVRVPDIICFSLEGVGDN